jgi:hypothetical protein
MNQAQHFSAHAEAEDRKLRKELTFGGPCFEGTLQKPPFPLGIRLPNQVPWPGQLSAAFLAKPALLIFRCRTRTRVAEKRPASHTNALGALFIAEEGGFVQGEVYEG